MQAIIETRGAGSRAWAHTTLDLSRVVVTLSSAVADELRDFIHGQRGLERIEEVAVAASDLPQYAAAVNAFRSEVEQGSGLVLVQPVDGLSPREIQLHDWVFSNLLGEPLVQNEEGDKLIHMWDRDPTMRRRDGARYHQTREGGDIHTDNVNAPGYWEYLVVGCVQPAFIGGWNVLLSGFAVHDTIAKNAPVALEILQTDFLWEYRGIKDDVYRAPVLSYDPQGEPHFRYLRTYMEAAHAKAGEPMGDQQIWALNVLDAVLDVPELQLLYKLSAGEILVANDSQIFHARTCFSDPLDSVSIDEQTAGGSGPLRRTYERTWVRKNA